MILIIGKSAKKRAEIDSKKNTTMIKNLENQESKNLKNTEKKMPNAKK